MIVATAARPLTKDANSANPRSIDFTSEAEHSAQPPGRLENLDASESHHAGPVGCSAGFGGPLAGRVMIRFILSGCRS
jgi:hypothetical protein